MAKRNGLRIFVLSLVGTATLVCLVFAGLLVRLAIRTMNTSDEQVAARNEKQDEVNQAFADAFGDTEGGGGDFGEIEINLGSNIPVPGGGTAPGGIPAPPVVADVTVPPVEEIAPTESTSSPVVANGAQTITLDVDAQGKVSYDGQVLNEAALTAFLDTLDDDATIVLDIDPACEEEMTQFWQYICYQAGYTARMQRVADLQR